MNNNKKEINKCIQHVGYNNFDYAINISLMNKYVYVETPKVGCSTIKDTLQRMELDYPDLVRDDFEHIHERRYSPLLSPSQIYGVDRLLNNPDYFIFCFVRNPYTRLLSAYLDKIANCNPEKNNPAKKNILVSMGEDPSLLSKKVSFQEFVDIVCDQNVLQMNPHWRIQYFQTFQDCINYDFIGKMENFQNDCVHVFSKIRADYEVYYRSELRHATNSKDVLARYYNEATREKVFNKFRIDFEYFGYDED